MSSTLESSVTLDDVFLVVGAKRVPLAPELAGYLALEIAEGATEAAGEVDPRSVYIGEEGSVALVLRPRREVAGSGDAEGSIRAILTRLLEASGSQTPALGSVSRRRSTSSGLHVLIEELEAALIPVNRAAGRRALARLAREVKRVTLGVGRNASLSPGEPPPRRPSSPSYTAVREGVVRPPQEEPRPPPRAEVVDGESAANATSAARSAPEELTARHDAIDPFPARPPEALPPAPPPPDPPPPPPPPASPDASDLPTVEVRKEQIQEALASHAARGSAPRVRTPEPVKVKEVDEVDHLLASFAVSSRGEQAQRNALKALVGLEPTPPPPGTQRFDDEPREAAADTVSAEDVESLLAIGDGASGPVRPERIVRTLDPAPRGLASPPTAISPSLAREPIGTPPPTSAARSAGVPSSAPTVMSAVSPPPRGRAPSDAGQNEPQEAPRAVTTSPSARRLVEMGSIPDSRPPPDRALPVFAVVVLLAGGAALWFLRPSLFSHEVPRPLPLSPVASAAPPAAPRCRASLTVTDAPAGAGILVRAGQAPVDVERMPIGPRLEFVATAEGFAPKRAVIPAGATWDTGTDGKPRYEVAVQLDRSHARPGAVDAWPAGEPGSDVGGKGAPGTVHLVTTPRGAEVWQLAALGPDAQFDVKCGGEVEILVAGPTTLRKRLRVPEAAFASADGGADRQATVSSR